MSLPLLISAVAFMAATEATPFIWDLDKRDESSKEWANADPTTKKEPTSTKKPTSTSKKPASSTKKASSSAAQPTNASAQPTSVAASITEMPSSTTAPSSTQPPLMVVNPTNNNASSSGALASSTSTAQKDTASTESGGISGGAIGGIVAAIIIIIAGIIAYFFLRRKKNIKQRNMNSRMSKPDPFTMGFGSDQAFQSGQPQMQQNNLQVNTTPYQHQYGTVQPAIAVTSPTTPSSPYYNSNNTAATQFHDANNHIIAGSMMPAIVPQHTQQPQQAYQYQPQSNQQYQPNTIYQQDQPDTLVSMNDSNNTNALNTPATTAATAGLAGAAVATGIGAGSAVSSGQQPLLQPTQAGSVGVFYVAATYTPTLSDEIDIQTGDQVEILVEYDDGWCQGINLTRGNVKGVFPKHCIDYPTTEEAVSNNGEVDRVKRVSSMYIAQ